jgi:hypothetical protein
MWPRKKIIFFNFSNFDYLGGGGGQKKRNIKMEYSLYYFSKSAFG